MKKAAAFLLIISTLLQAESINSIEYINLTRISSKIASETSNLKVGEELNIDKINKAIKKFYDFGYFDDIVVKTSDNGTLQFLFDEKPSITNLEIKGYKTRKDDINSLKTLIGLKKGSMYSKQGVKKAKNILLKELEKDGYINSIVEVDVKPINKNAVSLVFNVNKGDEIIIKKVNYIGAKKLNKKDFEKVTANKQRDSIPWWFGQNNGELKLDQLKYENLRINQLYFQNGYLDAKVKDPFLKIDFASNEAKLDFFIHEGKQYKVDTIKIFVDKPILNLNKVYPKLKLKKGDIFDTSKLRQDIDFIKTEVSNLGYAFSKVKYDLKKDPKNKKTNVVFNVTCGEKVYINDVKISGNNVTLDRVIRRDIYLAPGDLFNLTDYKDSILKLKRTGYFDKVQIQQKKISENKMDLLVKVVESSRTSNIIFGGGYGSYDKLILDASLYDRNVFGSGIELSLSTQLSKKQTNFKFEITNPSIYDSKYKGSVEIHNNNIEINRDYYDLNRKSTGFSIGGGKEFTRNTYIGARYAFDSIEERYDYKNDYPKFNKDYISSSITPYINFNNTDSYYLPRNGFKIGTSMKIAGIGGDSRYIKSNNYLKYFYSLKNKLNVDWIFRYRTTLQAIIDMGQINSGDSLYLGGFRTLRGFKAYAFGPNDSTIDDPYKRLFSTSVELNFPLIPSAKIRGSIFYDYGMIGENSFNQIKRSSTGITLEWISPVAPIQFIFSKPINKEANDDTSPFMFSLGSSF